MKPELDVPKSTEWQKKNQSQAFPRVKKTKKQNKKNTQPDRSPQHNQIVAHSKYPHALLRIVGIEHLNTK